MATLALESPQRWGLRIFLEPIAVAFQSWLFKFQAVWQVFKKSYLHIPSRGPKWFIQKPLSIIWMIQFWLNPKSSFSGGECRKLQKCHLGRYPNINPALSCTSGPCSCFSYFPNYRQLSAACCCSISPPAGYQRKFNLAERFWKPRLLISVLLRNVSVNRFLHNNLQSQKVEKVQIK